MGRFIQVETPRHDDDLSMATLLLRMNPVDRPTAADAVLLPPFARWAPPDLRAASFLATPTGDPWLSQVERMCKDKAELAEEKKARSTFR